MNHISAITQQTRFPFFRLGQKGQFLLALLVGAALALISWQVGVLDGSTNFFGGVAGSAAEASGPGALIAVGAALISGPL